MQLLEKVMENVVKHKDIKLTSNEARRNYLVSKPNYERQNLLAVEMKKAQIFMNKTVHQYQN